MNFVKSIHDETVSDGELVYRFRQSGDISVLGSLYQRYMELVYGVCLKYLKDAEQSKDAVMQIFEELVVKLPKHEVDNFKSWLYVLARNHCLMQLRSPKNLKTTAFNPTVVYSEENGHLNGAQEKEEQFVLMEDCLSKLPEEQKQTVKKFYLDQKCYKEIAEETGADFNKVRSLIQNGKRNLKICMEKKIKERASNI
jgi:RNA polymerase sigma-70 factor (ECF subfamily)